MTGQRLSLPRRAFRCPRVWIAGCITAVVAPVTFADVVVLTATRDNTIFNNGNSNGAGNAIFSGRTGPFGGEVVQRGLLAFNVADGVPAGATVVSASVGLSLVQASALGGASIHSLHRVTSDWGEGTSNSGGGTGAAPTSGDATWLHTFFSDQFWTDAGGDVASDASSSQTVDLLLGTYTWGSTPQLIADVQSMLDDPAGDYGWLLLGDELMPNSAKKFGSSDAVDAELHPTLTIEFMAPACPWDCGDADGTVGIIDFLTLLGQWGSGAGSSCDLGLGAPGVGIDEFLAQLANWGPCP